MPGSPGAEITLDADLENLGRFLEVVSGLAAGEKYDARRSKMIELAVEEAIVNVINHAYTDAKGMLTMSASVDADRRLVLTIKDQGRPFDVSNVAEPDIGSGVESRKIGGLGVFFIRQVADEIRYAREDDSNVMTMVFSPEGRPKPETN
ncbi:MAG: ATP-binding protein [Proteobacteria bacterium]|nr:ATP-binding protein [Pseudomonadota bacterium]